MFALTCFKVSLFIQIYYVIHFVSTLYTVTSMIYEGHYVPTLCLQINIKIFLKYVCFNNVFITQELMKKVFSVQYLHRKSNFHPNQYIAFYYKTSFLWIALFFAKLLPVIKGCK